MKKSFTISLLIHLGLIALLIIPFYGRFQRIGNTQKIQVHLATDTFLFHQVKQQATQHTIGQQQATQQQILQQKNLSGQENKLAIFFHDAIQQSLQSIHTSSEGDYSQQVTLHFTISPEGTINSTHLAESTGDRYVDDEIISRVKGMVKIPQSLLVNKRLAFQIQVKINSASEKA